MDISFYKMLVIIEKVSNSTTTNSSQIVFRLSFYVVIEFESVIFSYY